jgi:uncharacterized membrane protein YbaN (DUF454 family)
MINEAPEKKQKFLKKPARIALISLGTFFLCLGIVGIFIPILPTTPFLLIAAALYARSSQKFYSWLMNNRLFGRYIKSYREGKGIPLKIKLITITLLWITIGISAIFATDILWIRILLAAVAAGVTIHIATIKTYRRSD